MGFVHYNPVWEIDISPTEKFVLLALAKFANVDHQAWPSYETLVGLTGLNRSSVARSLAKLKGRGIIDSHKRNHYVVYNLAKLMQKPSLTEGLPSLTEGLPSLTVPPPSLTVGHKYNIEDNTEKTIEVPCYSHGKAKEPETMTKYPAGMNASEVMGHIKSKPKHDPKSMIAKLEFIWKTNIPLIIDSIKFVKPLSMKEKGQLKLFITALGDVPPIPVFNNVLENWYEYALYVKDKCGISSVPEVPSIPFILKYAGEAVNFKKKGISTGDMKLVSHPKPLFKPVTTKLEIPEHKKATLEDIEALEKELGL